MKTFISLMFAVLVSGTSFADSLLVSNPQLPYPPSCAYVPDPYAQGGLENIAVKFYDQEVVFYDAQDGEEIPLRLRAFRMPCSEPNRSLVWLEFILAAEHNSRDLAIQLPSAVVETGWDYRLLLNLATGPNGLGSDAWVDRKAFYLHSRLQGLRWYYGSPVGERRWVFLLDNGPLYPGLPYGWFSVTPDQYNEAFRLVLRYVPYDFITIDVPSTASLIPATTAALSLSGRHSGNWVVSDTSDQGIVLSVSEMIGPNYPGGTSPVNVAPDKRMVVFLAHYTFDDEGRMLWLTGAAEFGPGATSVTIPMERVENGLFRGAQPASRQVIGSVTLTSRSCNNLEFDYDYQGVQLGSGTRKLERIFSLEIAGHECRDMEARAAALR